MKSFRRTRPVSRSRNLPSSRRKNAGRRCASRCRFKRFHLKKREKGQSPLLRRLPFSHFIMEFQTPPPDSVWCHLDLSAQWSNGKAPVPNGCRSRCTSGQRCRKSRWFLHRRCLWRTTNGRSDPTADLAGATGLQSAIPDFQSSPYPLVSDYRLLPNQWQSHIGWYIHEMGKRREAQQLSLIHISEPTRP